MSFTLVAFHAHPDDEALLTGGTLARAATEGHRVVLVVATDGGAGLAADRVRAGHEALAVIRRQELTNAANALGITEVIDLGYGDSGLDGSASGARLSFTQAGLDEPAHRLADVLRSRGADVLTIYDRAGGYGHPDHIHLHAVGTRAAALAATPVVLEATVDRGRLLTALRLIKWFPRLPPGFDPDAFGDRFTPRPLITHRVNVRRYAAAKRAALAAHASQASGDAEVRTLAVLLRLPRGMFRLAFGCEWFVEHGRHPDRRPVDDIFATLRAGTRVSHPVGGSRGAARRGVGQQAFDT